MRTSCAIVLLLVASLTATACGGTKATSSTSTGSSTSSTPTIRRAAPPSSAQFVAKANALCRQDNAKIARLWGRQIQSAALIERVASVADEYNAKLHALKPPSKQAAAYARFMAAYERQASKTHKLAKSPRGTVKEDLMVGFNMVVVLPRAAEPDRVESSRIAQSLGLKACTGSTTGGMGG